MSELLYFFFWLKVLEFDFISLFLNNRLVKEIQMLFNGLFFVQVIQSALVFANSAFLLIAVDQSKKELMVPAFWLSTFLAEMAIYCYFGNNIIYTVCMPDTFNTV